jgi:hypothetical protein
LNRQERQGKRERQDTSAVVGNVGRVVNVSGVHTAVDGGEENGGDGGGKLKYARCNVAVVAVERS